jgi:hypothetical protein
MLSAASVTRIEQNDLQSPIGRPLDELMTPALLLVRRIFDQFDRAAVLIWCRRLSANRI